MTRFKLSHERILVTLTQVGIVGALLIGWQIFPDILFDEFLVSRPSLIAAQTVEWLGNGVLFQAATATLKVVVYGLFFGGVTGIVFGILAALVRPVEYLVEPLINAFFAMPKVALVPLFILWFGVGPLEHTVFTSVVVFFFFFFSIFNGIRNVPRELVNAMALIGASLPQALTRLYIPASFGWILSGLRLAIPYAFVAAISAEIIASSEGLGHLVKVSAGVFNAAGVFAAILTLLVISVTISTTALTLGRNSRWYI